MNSKLEQTAQDLKALLAAHFESRNDPHTVATTLIMGIAIVIIAMIKLWVAFLLVSMYFLAYKAMSPRVHVIDAVTHQCSGCGKKVNETEGVPYLSAACYKGVKIRTLEYMTSVMTRRYQIRTRY